MKPIYEHAIGDDGVVAGLYVDGEFIIEQVKYPIKKAIEPADKFIDSVIDGLEAKIPGDWDRLILEPARAAGHAEVKRLAGG